MLSIYLVGGAMRDIILGKVPNDMDYTVEAESYEQMKSYLEENFIILYEKPEFLTIRVKSKDKKTKDYADYVLSRKDGNYRDGRRPENVTMGTIYDDLSRRDFRMNAIARKLDNTIVDPYDGITDIKKKIIRCVGSTDRLKEDSLRLLRAIRFHITLEFDLDAEIIKCLNDQSFIDLLDNISVERIREEINKCLEYNTLRTLHVLRNYPLLEEYLFSKRLKLKPVII